jgi:hypothetical protein
VSKAGLKDDRLQPGSDVKIIAGPNRTAKEIKLGFRKKASGKDKEKPTKKDIKGKEKDKPKKKDKKAKDKKDTAK